MPRFPEALCKPSRPATLCMSGRSRPPAAELPARQRILVWTAGAGLVLTRVFLLAHWASDVAVGLALGTALERVIRLFTGYGRPGGA